MPVTIPTVTPVTGFVHPTETAFVENAFAVQTAQGTAGTSYKKFFGTNLSIQPKFEDSNFTPYSSLAPTAKFNGKEWTEISMDGILTFEETPYFIRTVEGVSQNDPPMVSIYSNGYEYKDCVATGWSISGDASKVDISITMLGDTRKKITAPTPTGTAITAFGGGFTLKIDDVEITNASNFKIDCSNVWVQQFYQDQTVQTYTQTQPTTSFTALLDATDANNAISLGAARNGIHTVEVVLTAGTAGTLTLSGSIFLGEPSSATDNGGVFAYTLNGVFTTSQYATGEDLITVAYSAAP